MRKILIFFLILIFILSITVGCDQREINDLAIVVAVGIDYIEDSTVPIQITIQIINPYALSIKGKGKTTEVLTARGISIHDTLRSFSEQLPKILFFGQNQVIVFGKGLAENGIAQVTDFLRRSVEIRMTNWVVVSSTTAKELLEASFPIEDVPASGMEDLLEHFQRTSFGTFINLKDLIVSLSNDGKATSIPLLGIDDGKIIYKGTGIFDKDKMIGELNTKESRGLLWITSSIVGGNITTPCSTTNSKEVQEKKYTSYKINKTSNKIIPEISNGHPEINIKIEVNSTVYEYLCSEDINDKTLTKLEKEQTEDIKNLLNHVIKLAQNDYHSDIFGFGEKFHQKYPEEWKKYKDDWGEIFSSLEVNIEIKSVINNIGIINNHIQTN